MIELFAKCTKCGLVGRRVRKALSINPEILVHKTGRNSPESTRHMAYLEQAQMSKSYTTDIIVDNDKVYRLEEWISLNS